MRLISTSTDKELRCQVGFDNISRGAWWLNGRVLEQIEGLLVQFSPETRHLILYIQKDRKLSRIDC